VQITFGTEVRERSTLYPHVCRAVTAATLDNYTRAIYLRSIAMWLLLVLVINLLLFGLMRRALAGIRIQQQIMSFSFLMIMLQIVTGIAYYHISFAAIRAGIAYSFGKPCIWRAILFDAEFIPVGNIHGGTHHDEVGDFSKLIKFRLTFLVVFSASISFIIAVKANGGNTWGSLYSTTMWMNWLKLVAGGFLVTAAANCFNEVIEVDLDKLMKRTMDRPMPAGRMTTGQGLVLGLGMGMAGTYILGTLNILTGLLSVFSILLYAFAYTPLKRKSPVAVFVGAIPGALPALIGYVAGQPHGRIDEIALILFSIQFVWQFVHFWAIAWVLDDDYKLAGFRLLPTQSRDKAARLLPLYLP
jgi:protoheme IX farnesyltransferase